MIDSPRTILWALGLCLTGCLGSGQVNSSSGSPAGSGSSSSGDPGGIHHDTPLNGLSVDALHFSVTGDCRPDNYVNTASQVPAVYPTAIATKLFQQQLARGPQFGVFTGDVVYVYRPPDTSSAAAQIDQFLQARSAFDRPLAVTLGNHDAYYNTPDVWKQKFGFNTSYYSFTVHAGSDDAIFIVADDMNWDARESAWAAEQLALPARYHIFIKHFPSDSTDSDISGVKADIASVLDQHPPTLILSGHEHNYAHRVSRELVLGEGGAKLASTARGYGYAMVDQQGDGSLAVTVYDSATDSQVDQWQVTP